MNQHSSDAEATANQPELVALDPRDLPSQAAVANHRRILDVGCGRRHLKGERVVTIDCNPQVNPTIVHDLSKYPWPLEANTFDFIHCSQVIEHLPDIVDAISEILRVAAPGCQVFIGVPHFSSAIAYRDPTHRTFFSVKTMTYFDERGVRYLDLRQDKCLEIVSQRITFSKFWHRIGLAALFNKIPRYYAEKLHGIFPAKFITWELRVKALDESVAQRAA